MRAVVLQLKGCCFVVGRAERAERVAQCDTGGRRVLHTLRSGALYRRGVTSAVLFASTLLGVFGGLLAWAGSCPFPGLLPCRGSGCDGVSSLGVPPGSGSESPASLSSISACGASWASGWVVSWAPGVVGGPLAAGCPLAAGWRKQV